MIRYSDQFDLDRCDHYRQLFPPSVRLAVSSLNAKLSYSPAGSHATFRV